MIFCTHLVDSLLPLERLLGSRRFPEFLTDKQKNLASRAQILANPASRAAVKSRIPSRYFAFSRIPHRILAKSRIPRIPFQTLYEKNENLGGMWDRLNTPGNHHGKVKMVLLPPDYKQSLFSLGDSQAKEHASKREDHLSRGNVTRLMSASVVSQRETACSLTSPSFFPSHP